MKVLPHEPEPKTLTVLTNSKILSQEIREQLFIKGMSDHDYTCGLCNHLLLESITPEAVRNIVYQCPICGAYNVLDDQTYFTGKRGGRMLSMTAPFTGWMHGNLTPPH